LTLALLPYAASSTSVIVLLVLISSLTILVAVRPYQLRVDNLLESILLLFAIFVYLLDSIFLYSNTDDSAALFHASQILWTIGKLLAMICILISMLGSRVLSLLKEKRQRTDTHAMGSLTSISNIDDLHVVEYQRLHEPEAEIL